jgi:hypothetical protein
VIFAVARMRWRMALVDLRSSLDECEAADFAYKVALLSAGRALFELRSATYYSKGQKRYARGLGRSFVCRMEARASGYWAHSVWRSITCEMTSTRLGSNERQHKVNDLRFPPWSWCEAQSLEQL